MVNHMHQRARQWIAIAGCISLLTACATAKPSMTDTQNAQRRVVENYFAALNRRDLLALTLYVTPNIEWYSSVDGERILEVAGREPLKGMLTSYFAQNANTEWRMLDAESTDAFVAVTERTQWQSGAGVQTRTTIGVFQIEDGRIRRITYFLNPP
jgi:limonene-1,2-epoxide hydrolase